MSLTPTRRTVLKSGAAAAGAAAALGTSGSLLTDLVRMPRAYGAPPTGRLVVLFLRGAQDGLSAVVPYTETAYYDARPTIAVPADQVLDLDGQFGFHPTMAQLHTLYQANRLAVVVGAANLAGNRSHFTAQDLWEWGAVSAPPDGSGWRGRDHRSNRRARARRGRQCRRPVRVDREQRHHPRVRRHRRPARSQPRHRGRHRRHLR